MLFLIVNEALHKEIHIRIWVNKDNEQIFIFYCIIILGNITLFFLDSEYKHYKK